MIQDIYIKLETRWNTVKSNIEIADAAFIILRVIVLGGGIAWLIFSDLPRKTTDDVSILLVCFVVYGVSIYLGLFISPGKKRIIYVFALFFDISFISLLVRATGGFESSFFNGFYLIAALYSFYYGLVYGVIVALISSVLYPAGSNFDFDKLSWTDFSVRIAFLYLIALPLGMLSQKMKRDKDKMDNLNRELEESIGNLRYVQGKLIQAEKLSAIGRLTADVAHEIRNPLTSIGGFVRRLNKITAPGSKAKEYAETVMSEVDRLEKILRDVLTFSREARLNLEYQEINEPVKESVRTVAEICNEQSIITEKHFDTSLPPVLIDRGQVRQAVNNLILNAIDAMPEGGTLKINTFMEELYDVKYVVAGIADTGAGIPVEKLNMIFEPFYTTKEIGIGTGLGLSICKKIIDEHNGLITVKAGEGKGTSFKMYFPYQSKEDDEKTKCWEFHKCGVEKTEGAAEMRCPAYPNYGRICWAVAGTFCGKKVSGAIAQKLGDCRKCEFYKRVVVQKDL